MNAMEKINNELEDDLLKNNYWVSRLRAIFAFNEKVYKKEKEVLIDILAKVDLNSIKYN